MIATKVGKLPGLNDLRPETIKRGRRGLAEAAGGRRRSTSTTPTSTTTETPLAETLGAFGELIEAGKVRYIAASNYSRRAADRGAGDRRARGPPPLRRPAAALQPDGARLRDRRSGRSASARTSPCFPFFALARGFLTGKYRPGGEEVDSPRAEGAAEYLDERGERMLAALDEIAAAHGVEPAAVALAWLREQPTVLAPIASARNERAASAAAATPSSSNWARTSSPD